MQDRIGHRLLKLYLLLYRSWLGGYHCKRYTEGITTGKLLDMSPEDVLGLNLHSLLGWAYHMEAPTMYMTSGENMRIEIFKI